jgi:hypothetical protein
MEQNTAGSKNTAIGYRAYAMGFAYGNATAIGANSQVTASNQMRFGDELVTSIGGKVSWSKISDERFKVAVRRDVPGLSFINRLEPVTYLLDNQKLRTFQGRALSKDETLYTRETGFLAQQVEAAAQAAGFDFSGVDRPASDQDHYALRYADFTVPLVQAVQELSAENEALKAKIQELEAEKERLLALEKEVAAIKAMLGTQAKANEEE